jgi:uncharacterized coiled-coil protein SlyX
MSNPYLDNKSKLHGLQKAVIMQNETIEAVNHEIELLEKTGNLSKMQKYRLEYLKERLKELSH